MIAVSGAMIIEGGLVLLARRAAHRRICPNLWDFPGGHLEAGESPEAALERELLEELGARPVAARRLAVLDFSPEAGSVLHYQLFRADGLDRPPVLANDEHTDLAWMEPLEASRLPDLASGRYRRFLREAARDS